MDTSGALQVWAGRLCLAAVAVLAWAGLYYENIRFIPSAAGFAILAAVCYGTGRPVRTSRRFRDSGPRAVM